MLLVDYTFRTLQDMRDLNDLTGFLHNQDLGYPGYHDWVERSKPEILAGNKVAILARYDKRLVGDIIVQPHKSLSTLFEIKNIRIHPELRDEGCGRFLVKQVINIAKKGNYSGIIVDVREDQPQTTQFFMECGFSPVMVLPLYEKEKSEIVMVKLLEDRDTSKSLVQKVISSLN